MKTAIALGTFDGLHKGHRAVLGKTQGFYTVAVTFDIPPKAFFGGSRELLMTPRDKETGLKALGVSEIFTLDFNRIFDMPAESFFEMLKEKYNPALFACGFNYRFGAGAKGDTKLLSELCEKNGIEFVCVESVGGNEPVSSSMLRGMVANGDVKGANEQIFGGFGFSSEVLHGDARGKTLGFPTINQQFPDVLVKPKFGVYKSRVIIDGKEYDSITNIGVRPTYKTDFIGCETYIKNFSADIYGKIVTLKFMKFIREEEKFSTAESLINAVKSDIKSVLGVEI